MKFHRYFILHAQHDSFGARELPLQKRQFGGVHYISVRPDALRFRSNNYRFELFRAQAAPKSRRPLNFHIECRKREKRVNPTGAQLQHLRVLFQRWIAISVCPQKLRQK